MTRKEQIQKLIDEKNDIDNYSCDYQVGVCNGNTIKRIFKSIFKGIGIALLVGIYAIGIGILYLVIRRMENWEFTWVLILIAFFSSIYYYRKNK